MGLHQNSGNSNFILSPQRSSNLLLPRRLATGGSFQRSTSFSVTGGSSQAVGFLVNWDKSSLSPSQVPTYLGAALDCPNRLARPTGLRVSALQEVIFSFHESEFDSGQNLASFVGSYGQHDGLDPGLSHVDEALSVPSFEPLRPSV